MFAFALATYIGFNVFVMMLAGSSLELTAGVPVFVGAAVTCVAAALIALVGYDWIHRVARWITAVFVVVFAVLTVAVLVTGHLGGGAFTPGPLVVTPFLLQFGPLPATRSTGPSTSRTTPATCRPPSGPGRCSGARTSA